MAAITRKESGRVSNQNVSALYGEWQGHLEVARGWLYKWRDKAPHRWEWRLFILQDTGMLAYFCEGFGGSLEKRGLIDVRGMDWLRERHELPSWAPSGDIRSKGTTFALRAVQLFNKKAKPRVFILKCPSVESAEKWGAVLEAQRGKQRVEQNTLASPRPPPSSAQAIQRMISGRLSHGGASTAPSSPSGHKDRDLFADVSSEISEESINSRDLQATQNLVQWLLPLEGSAVVKCGWLLKWHGAFPNRKWKRRLFVLRSDFLVRYYAEVRNGTLEERGEFELRSMVLLNEGVGRACDVEFEALQTCRTTGQSLQAASSGGYSGIDGKQMMRRRFLLRAAPRLGVSVTDPDQEMALWVKTLKEYKLKDEAERREAELVQEFKLREQALRSPPGSGGGDQEGATTEQQGGGGRGRDGGGAKLSARPSLQERVQERMKQRNEKRASSKRLSPLTHQESIWSPPKESSAKGTSSQLSDSELPRQGGAEAGSGTGDIHPISLSTSHSNSSDAGEEELVELPEIPTAPVHEAAGASSRAGPKLTRRFSLVPLECDGNETNAQGDLTGHLRARSFEATSFPCSPSQEDRPLSQAVLWGAYYPDVACAPLPTASTSSPLRFSASAEDLNHTSVGRSHTFSGFDLSTSTSRQLADDPETDLFASDDTLETSPPGRMMLRSSMDMPPEDRAISVMKGMAWACYFPEAETQTREVIKTYGAALRAHPISVLRLTSQNSRLTLDPSQQTEASLTPSPSQETFMLEHPMDLDLPADFNWEVGSYNGSDLSSDLNTPKSSQTQRRGSLNVCGQNLEQLGATSRRFSVPVCPTSPTTPENDMRKSTKIDEDSVEDDDDMEELPDLSSFGFSPGPALQAPEPVPRKTFLSPLPWERCREQTV